MPCGTRTHDSEVKNHLLLRLSQPGAPIVSPVVISHCIRASQLVFQRRGCLSVSQLSSAKGHIPVIGTVSSSGMALPASARQDSLQHWALGAIFSFNPSFLLALVTLVSPDSSLIFNFPSWFPSLGLFFFVSPKLLLTHLVIVMG